MSTRVFGHAATALVCALVAIAALLGARGLTTLIAALLSLSAEERVASHEEPVAPAPEPTPRAIEARAAPPDPPRPVARPVRACSGVRARAVVGADDAAYSFAALSYDGGAAHLRRRGDKVGDRRVAHVGVERVWLEERDGTLCEAALWSGEPEKIAARVDPPAKTAGVSMVDPGHYAIDRGALDAALDTSEAIRGLAVVPRTVNGATVAMRLARVSKALEAIGLRAGDEVQSINGFAVTNPESLLSAYARLRTASRFVVVLERNGAPMQLDYDVR